MIFYGTKAHHLKSEKISTVKCSYCEKQTSHTISIFAKYAHVYWIPFFPYGKKAISECDNCKKTLELKDMSEPLKKAYYDQVKVNIKTPIWHWSGVAIIALIIAFTIYASNKHKKDAIVYINNPQVGDVYEYKPNDYYSLLKVSSITNDSIFVISNSYEIERQSKLYKIDKKSNYTTSPFAISKQEIKEWYETKKILDVDRD